MGIFGWSYPPGCSGPPEHYEQCEVCGRDADSCECPECPVCGEAGRRACYDEGHIIGPVTDPSIWTQPDIEPDFEPDFGEAPESWDNETEGAMG